MEIILFMALQVIGLYIIKIKSIYLLMRILKSSIERWGNDMFNIHNTIITITFLAAIVLIAIFAPEALEC